MNRLRILHLEDSAADAELIQAALEQDSPDVELAHVFNPIQFKAALETGQFDLILVDNALPTFNGLAALNEVEKRCPDVPVVFLSGNVDEAQIKRSLQAGAADYVVKGNMPHLLAVLEQIKERIKRKKAQ